MSEARTMEQVTVYEMGQRVAVFDECEHYICDGTIDGILTPDPPNGEEFYDIKLDGFGRIDNVSEMRLTNA